MGRIWGKYRKIRGRAFNNHSCKVHSSLHRYCGGKNEETKKKIRGEKANFNYEKTPVVVVS